MIHLNPGYGPIQSKLMSVTLYYLVSESLHDLESLKGREGKGMVVTVPVSIRLGICKPGTALLIHLRKITAWTGHDPPHRDLGCCRSITGKWISSMIHVLTRRQQRLWNYRGTMMHYRCYNKPTYRGAWMGRVG